MDRNTLLNSSRHTFMATFARVIDYVVHCCIARLYDKAERSPSSQIQRHFLDARTLLAGREAEVAYNIVTQLDILLTRSFQTAYSTFRPSFFTEAKSAPLALMDITVFEDDLRIDLITSRFRSEAEEQLRDLNIRIAILFERNDIAERENPFRPYLLSRAITLGVECIEPEPDLFVILTEQLCEELLGKVALLYDEINRHLSECGVAAQLQFKSQRMPFDSSNLFDIEDLVTEPLSMRSFAAASNGDDSPPGKAGRVEQLINRVRSRGLQASRTDSPMPDVGPAETGNASFAAESGTEPRSQVESTVNGWLGGAQEVGATLRRIFFGGSAEASDGMAAPATELAADAVPWQSGDGNLVAISPQLKQALHVPVPNSQDMVSADGEIRNLIIERRDVLNAIATGQQEKMTIDIVAMLFEFILKDHQVPAEVRAQLGRLQFSVLKMALMDSALLTKKSHPARLLVNRIGSISVGLHQIDPSGARISAEIQRIVEEMLSQDAENPELFSKMLDQLDRFIASELLASNTKIAHAVQAVAQAEYRSQKLNLENTRLDTMLEGISITPYLRRFLLDTWSLVIERVERNSAMDSTRFRLLVPNVLWSVLPKAHREDRSMLLQIIPIIVPVLREGMGLVAWLPEHQQAFLSWLVDAHTLVMRTQVGASPCLSLVEIQRHFHQFVYPDAEPLPSSSQSDQVDLHRIFLDEAIKELEQELQQTDILHDLDRVPELSAQDDLNTAPQSGTHGLLLASADTGTEIELNAEDDLLNRLRSGVVVEINLSGSPTKGRLNWISPNSSNLILTVNGQEAPSIISVRMFRRMLKNSRARFVEVAPLFERAVQSLLESADLVDLAHTS